MNEQQIQETLKYLEMIRDLENIRMEQEELLDALDTEIQKLGHPAPRILPPQKKTVTAVTQTPESIGSCITGGLFVGGIGGILLYLFGGFILTELGARLTATLSDLCTFVVIGAIVGALARLASRSSSISRQQEKIRREQEQLDREYEQEYEEYEARLREDKHRVERENEEVKSLRQIRGALSKRNDETTSLLADLYRARKTGGCIIHPDYRNYPAVCAFIHYLSTRICSDLIGANGAYAKYDDHYALESIRKSIDRNTQAVHNLTNQLSKDVTYLVQEIGKGLQNVNYVLDTICNQHKLTNEQLREVGETNRFIAWNTEQIKKEEAYRRYLDYGDWREHL